MDLSPGVWRVAFRPSRFGGRLAPKSKRVAEDRNTEARRFMDALEIRALAGAVISDAEIESGFILIREGYRRTLSLRCGSRSQVAMAFGP